MGNKAWKQREREAAKAFGALRNIGSGSQGRPDKSMSDSTHDRLYIEVKLRKKHTAVTLHDDIKSKAIKEHKVPVVLLAEANRPGFWILVHERNLAEVAAMYRPGQVSNTDEGSKHHVETETSKETEQVRMANAGQKDLGAGLYIDPLGRQN